MIVIREKGFSMRMYATAACVLFLASGFVVAQAPQTPGPQRGARQAAGGPDAARVVEGGGIFAAGWQGKVDAAEAANGQVVNNSKLAQEGDALHVTTGPSVTYWNPANRATGTYTVKATF